MYPSRTEDSLASQVSGKWPHKTLGGLIANLPQCEIASMHSPALSPSKDWRHAAVLTHFVLSITAVTLLALTAEDRQCWSFGWFFFISSNLTTVLDEDSASYKDGNRSIADLTWLAIDSMLSPCTINSISNHHVVVELCLKVLWKCDPTCNRPAWNVSTREDIPSVPNRKCAMKPLLVYFRWYTHQMRKGGSCQTSM